MRAVLQVLSSELKRLKANGVKSLPISDASLKRLRGTLSWRRSKIPSGSSAGPDSVASRQPNRDRPGVGNPSPTLRPGIPNPATGFPAPTPFELPAGGKIERWAALRERVLGDPVCRTHVRSGKQVVFGVGSIAAKVMFVGEAPGAEEEIQGEPFVGPAGQLLTKMINAMGLERSDVYIGNIMNWRPEMPVDARGVQYGNRPPTEQEMSYCLPYLKAQIEIVDPEVLVALGATASQGLLGFGTFNALGEVRGKWREFSGKPLMVTYHPSYILRNQSNRSKRMIWEDLLKVMERVHLPVTEKQRGYFLEK